MTDTGFEPITNDPMRITIRVEHHGQSWEAVLDARPSDGGPVDDIPNSPQWIAAKAAGLIANAAHLVQQQINPDDWQLVRVAAVGPNGM